MLPSVAANVPLGQLVHMADPGPGANEPLPHKEHPSPVLPIEANCGALPAAQGVQSVSAVAPGLEDDGMNWVPAGQPVHTEDFDFALKYVLGPQTQSEAFVDPMPAVVVPWGQRLHSPVRMHASL